MHEEKKIEYIVKSRKSLIIPNLTLSEFLAQTFSSQDPNLTAIINAENGSKVSYSELHQRIQQRASGFLKIGLVKTDLVNFFSENNIEYLISQLALIYLGITFSPLKPANGVYELLNQIRDSMGSVLIIDNEHMNIVKKAMNDTQYGSVIKQLKLLIVFDSIDNETIATLNKHPMAPERILSLNQIPSNKNGQLDRIPYFETTKDDHLIIVYTSGTTGQPKGAIHTHYSFLAAILIYKPTFTSLSCLFWFPMGHISGSFISLCQLCWGVTLVMESSTDLHQLLSLVERFQVDQLPISPSHALDLACSDYRLRYNLESLKFFSFGGLKIPEKQIEEIKKKYQVLIYEMYGATEMMGSVSQFCDGTDPPGSVGPPTANTEMKIVDLESGLDLPHNQQGEICFRGPARFLGYLRNEKATAETIDPQGWYHSGDIGYYDNNGNLFIIDRIKEMIKFRHWSISPTEVEVFLSRHPAVDSVCIVGVKHQTDGQLLRAYVLVRNGHEVTEEELIKYVEENLGFHKRLRAGVRFVKKIFRTSIGKVDRQYYHKLVVNEIITDPVL